MKATVCDICKKFTAGWKLKKRFFTKWFCNGLDDWYEELDICDDCIEKFKKFVEEVKP